MHRGAVFALVTGIAFASACSDSEPAAQRGHPLAAAGTSNTAGRPPHGSGGTSTEGGDAGGPSSTGATAGGGARAAEDSGTGKAGAKSHSSHPTPSGDDDDDTATGGTSNPPGSGGSATATAGEAASGEGGEPHDGGTSGSPHAGGTSGEPNDSGGWNTSGGPGSGTGGSSGTGGAASGAGGSGTAGAGEVSGAGGVSGSGATNLGGSGSVGTVNGQVPDCTDELDLPIVTKEPATLFDTGLYATADAAPDEVAPYVAPYTPRYALWSDGAEKTRYAYVPRCSTIDASDMDHWQFPVGTRFWKEFRVPEAGNALVETRFILRYGPGPNDWLFAAYQWPENAQHASDAKYVTAPVPDASGTTHDIPGPDDCTRCHTHEPERILGFGAIELSHSLGGLDIRTLSDNGWLNPPTASTFSPPGDATAQAALGYVHANCGPCHNENFDVGGDTPPRMRLSVFDAALADTGFYQTLLDVPTYNSDFAGIARVEPCDAANSEIIMRMSSRPVNQMPPFATEVADQTGIATVSAFINALPAPGHACGH